MSNGSHIGVVADEDCLDRFGPAVRQLCVGMIDEAIGATVVGEEGSGVESLQIGPVRVETHGSLGWWRQKRALADLVARLRKFPPDVVHAVSGGCAWLGAHLANALDVPLVISLTGREELNEETAPYYHSAAKVLAVSESLRSAAMQYLRRSEDDIRRIPWGLMAGQEPSCFLDDDKSATFVTIAPLEVNIGLEDLIHAIGQLNRGPSPVLLFVLGAGSGESELRQRASRLGLNERITFVGPIREWASVLRGADGFVLPYVQPRLSMHPIAAMAAGVVVVAAGGNDHDCLIEGETARIYDPPCMELLSAVLAEVLADRQASRRLAASAQQYVADHYRASTMVSETVQLYRELTLEQETIRMPAPE